MAASLLLLLEEEDAFWMMATIVEDLLPASYYSSTLLGMYNIYPTVTHMKYFVSKLIVSTTMLNYVYYVLQAFRLTKEYFVH